MCIGQLRPSRIERGHAQGDCLNRVMGCPLAKLAHHGGSLGAGFDPIAGWHQHSGSAASRRVEQCPNVAAVVLQPEQ